MRILVAEDDLAVREELCAFLATAGHDVQFATRGDEVLPRIEKADLLLTDIQMPGLSGLELLQESRKRRPNLPVIVMTGFGSIPSAVEAIKLGAWTYLTKPFDLDELRAYIREIEDLRNLHHVADRAGRGDLVGSSVAMNRVYRMIDLAAASDASLIITGATGTGKELAAQAVHQYSSRRGGPFIAVNLAALPRDLVESELFGHERGAFSGAIAARKGRFLLAHKGTLFLDEIDSLPIELQAKLLRALETREIWPLGANAPTRIDVRFIAASNRDLEEASRTGAFREDLFFRLKTFTIAMPVLADHAEDMPAIARAFFEQSGYGEIEIAGVALSRLLTLPWRGNVREFIHVLEAARTRAVVEKVTPLKIEIRHLFEEEEFVPARNVDTANFTQRRQKVMDEWTRREIDAALVRAEGNVSEAARDLRLHRNALFKLIRKFGIKHTSG